MLVMENGTTLVTYYYYAHYLTRAAWHRSRTIMRQISPESLDIFDFIMDLYHACDGKWDILVAQYNITSDKLSLFLTRRLELTSTANPGYAPLQLHSEYFCESPSPHVMVVRRVLCFNFLNNKFDRSINFFNLCTIFNLFGL
jgi:hypothetical protein